MLAAARQRARKAGLVCTLTLDDIVIPSRCPVFGIPIEHQTGKRQSDNSPSIDRIVPSLGYTKSNAVIVSFRANRIKNDATVEELKRLVQFYEELL